MFHFRGGLKGGGRQTSVCLHKKASERCPPPLGGLLCWLKKSVARVTILLPAGWQSVATPPQHIASIACNMFPALRSATGTAHLCRPFYVGLRGAQPLPAAPQLRGGKHSLPRKVALRHATGMSHPLLAFYETVDSPCKGVAVLIGGILH